jgi:BlaI family penicillinase repressor
MAKHPSISEAEWEVMGVVWGRSPIAAGDVVDELAGKKKWSPKTVKTLLNRLVKKGALGFEVEGKRYLYRPKVSREECVRREGKSFVKRVFAGKAGDMLCQFVDEVELSREEIAQLKCILEQKAK